MHKKFKQYLSFPKVCKYNYAVSLLLYKMISCRINEKMIYDSLSNIWAIKK